jgi:hypothetical protein
MKTFMRVLVLAALVITIDSCAPTKQILHTIETNDSAAVMLTMNPGSTGNGVLMHCSNNVCIIITAAHVCSPILLVDKLMQSNLNGGISDDDAKSVIAGFIKLLDQNAFCNGKAFMKDSETPVDVIPILIDYDKDLMLLVAHMPDVKTNVNISALGEVKPGTSLYTVVIDTEHHKRLVLYSKAGLIVYGEPSRDHGQNYLQTYFPVGPGASGSGVFLERSNLLVGIIGAQFASSNPVSPIRGTFAIQVKDIRNVFQKYAEKVSMADTSLLVKENDDNKLNRPHCYGKKYLCELVHNEISLVEALGHSLNQTEHDNDEEAAMVQTDEPRSDGDGGVDASEDTDDGS